MDVIKKFLGLKNDGQVIFSTSPDSNNDDDDVSEKNILEPTPIPSFLTEKYPWLENAFRIQEGDCTSCKYIGSTVSYGISLFLLTQLKNPPREMVGRRLPFLGMVLPLSFTFFLIGSSRLFDIGLCRPRTDGMRKSMINLAKEDFEELVKYFDSKKDAFSNTFPFKEFNTKQNTVTNDSVKKD
ncbi:uncharacterized protein LOC106873613 [Octopus bimaculoides]|uniref:Transmembrane protein n=1 Tax=Octopus bimaculoides TaxID=37653 RepID=A0A0L8H0M6_OCTBM|nr:uncharacterized protein LOC106873613 [Octopus bimaculoides]XP_014776544.1 uncharacterized protein LOC106873613 [Octopus bimaculoides]|eukprot:XP_014776543.1 PREDICTED: uncharacterized protein LOC106873613 [Octopus bimaculoides]